MASSSCSSPEIPHASPTFDPSFFSYASLDDVLDELSTRFIMNLPEQELASVERVCFQVEQAHWYYEDFMRETNSKLPSLSLKKFSQLFFNSCPLLRQWSADHEQLFDEFMRMKVRVPVCGAIMLNDKWDKCLLVKGWKSSAGWGFPKGKINQLEELHMCAIREVQEETGFDLTKYIRPEDNIKMTIREQSVTLFIVAGVPEDYPFQCRTRKEISKIEWFKVSDLPTWKKNKHVTGKFYLISPFIPSLKEFIRVNKPSKRRQNRRRSAEQSVDLSVKTDMGRGVDMPVVSKEQERLELVPGALTMDRDAQGYSSSSADNGEPQTPSPQSSEAYPVATQADVDNDTEQIIDPHFARLINGLTLSASKSSLDEKTTNRTTSVTPTSANSTGTKNPTDEQLTDKRGNSISSAKDVSQFATVGKPPALVPPTLPLRATRPQSAQSISHPSTDRQSKHLALLESVAQESAALVSPLKVTPDLRPLIFNRQPVVPPQTIGVNVPAGIPRPGPSLPPTQMPGRVPQVNDPFIVRSRTSQAFFSPSQVPQQRRVSQNSLLSILNESRNNMPTVIQHPSLAPTHVNNTPINALHKSMGPIQHVPTAHPVPPQAFIQPNPGFTHGPPRNGMPQFMPLSASNLVGIQGGHPGGPMVMSNPALMHAPPGPRSPNNAHLLTLLSPSRAGMHLPQTQADVSRSNYASGNSIFPPRVSNSNGT